MKIGIIENYVIRYARSKKTVDKIIIAEVIKPITTFEKSIFGDARNIKFMIPQIGTISYDSDMPNKYNLLVHVEEGLRISSDAIFVIYGYPVPKNLDEYDIDPSEPAKMTEILDDSYLESQHKSIKSNDGECIIGISDNGIVLKSGNTCIGISKEGISFTGNVTSYDLPNKSNVIVKESGMMSLLPKAFVPPFAIPSHIPSTDLVRKVSSISRTISKLMKFKT